MYNFSSLLNITLHVSDCISVDHQESKTVNTASGMSYMFFDCLLAGMCSLTSSQRTCMTYLKLYVQSWTPDDGRKYSPKHVD